MTRWWTLGALAVGLVLAAASVAFEQGPGHRPRGHRGPPPLERLLEENAERLGLDAATRAEIRRIAEASRPKLEALHERLQALHQEMRTLLDSESPDEATVMTHAERIGAAETELQKQRLRTMLRIRALLTPEQRRELVEIHEERKQRREERFGAPRGARPSGAPRTPPDLAPP